MKVPIQIRIECARGEVMNAVEMAIKQYDLTPCMMDGVLSSVLAEVRSDTKVELINASNEMLREKNEELEKAKKEAKKVLKAESDEETEG